MVVLREWLDLMISEVFPNLCDSVTLDIRKKFFPMRVVRLWPRLPREAVAAPSLAVLKARLDGALSTLVWWKGSLPMARAWNWMVCKIPSNPKPSEIL